MILVLTWWNDTTGDLWEKWGHIADVAQIIGLVGIVFAVPQLVAIAREQRELSERQSKKPSLRVGFARNGEEPTGDNLIDEIEAPTIWRGYSNVSDNRFIEIITWNVGNDSASDAQWTFQVPADLPQGSVGSRGMQTPAYRNVEDGDRGIRDIEQGDRLFIQRDGRCHGRLPGN
jgi:hypothetical protein